MWADKNGSNNAFRSNAIFDNFENVFYLPPGSLNSIPVTLRESGIMTANRNKINNSIYLYF